MNQKEFKQFINDISNKLNPLNQLLYEILILIVFYYIFDTIQNIKSHKSFLLLITIICIILDLCIWSNSIQTSLFIAILIIYITYNMNKANTLDTFINTMNNMNTINKINNDTIKHKWELEEKEIQNQNEIDKITFIPKNFYNTNNNTKQNDAPEPYDKLQSEINEVNAAYKSNTPNIHITDMQYAKIMLNELYDTPQYKNIKSNEIDISLDNNIHSNNNNDTTTKTNNNTNNKNHTENNKKNNKNTNMDLFRAPKKEFLDDKWLSNKDNTYNDNCKTNNCSSLTTTDNKITPSRNQNAICSLVKYGVELSECTNQENTITNQQLVKISNNNVSGYL
jgi:hypothetical protein